LPHDPGREDYLRIQEHPHVRAAEKITKQFQRTLPQKPILMQHSKSVDTEQTRNENVPQREAHGSCSNPNRLRIPSDLRNFMLQIAKGNRFPMIDWI